MKLCKCHIFNNPYTTLCGDSGFYVGDPLWHLTTFCSQERIKERLGEKWETILCGRCRRIYFNDKNYVRLYNTFIPEYIKQKRKSRLRKYQQRMSRLRNRWKTVKKIERKGQI